VKKCGILFALCLTASVSLFAEDAAAPGIFSHPLQEADRSAFLAVCAELSSHPLVRGTFTQKREIASLKRTLTSSGTFVISAKKGMLWNTEKPFPSKMAVGLTQIVQTTPDGGQTVLDARGNETFTRLALVMQAVFTGNSKVLEDNFKLYWTGRGKKDSAWTLGLVPLDSTLRAAAGRFILSGKKGVLNTLAMLQENGGTVTYTLKDLHYSPALNVDEEAFFDAD
jgi:outer membrane lipoprotein-sorting protein